MDKPEGEFNPQTKAIEDQLFDRQDSSRRQRVDPQGFGRHAGHSGYTSHCSCSGVHVQSLSAIVSIWFLLE